MNDNRPRVTVRLVIIKSGKLLTSYNSADDFYYYIGGRLEFGETLLEGAEREVREELGKDVTFQFKKVLYIRDFIHREEKVHYLELFLLGEINKYTEVEHHIDPEHDGRNWSAWLDMTCLPANLYPKPLTPKILADYKNNFINSGEYVGPMSSA